MITKQENFGIEIIPYMVELRKKEEQERKVRLENKLKEREYKITVFKENENLIFYKSSELEPKEFYWSIRNKKRLEVGNGSYLIEGYKIFTEDITDYENHKRIKELIEQIK